MAKPTFTIPIRYDMPPPPFNYYINQPSSFWTEEEESYNINMPCFYISTNLDLTGVDVDPIFSQATKAIATIIGRPEHLVMVIIKGSVAISFNGNKEAAAYAELISMGGINKEVKRNLIATLGTILENNLSIPRTRFFLKVFDTTAAPIPSKL